MNLNKIKENIRNILYNQNISNIWPLHCAFEVEDQQLRTNFVFVLKSKSKQVLLFDTSRGSGNKLLMTFEEPDLPEGYKTANDYYTYLFRKAMRMEDIAFIGYVDDKTLKPFEENS